VEAVVVVEEAEDVVVMETEVVAVEEALGEEVVVMIQVHPNL